MNQIKSEFVFEIDFQVSIQSYKTLPFSQFQRNMRKNSSELRDHICKEKDSLATKRMELVPKTPGSNWKDLPNDRVEVGIVAKYEVSIEKKSNKFRLQKLRLKASFEIWQ